MRCLRKLRYFVIWVEKVQIFRQKIGNTEIPWHGILPFFERYLQNYLSFFDKKTVPKNRFSYFVHNLKFIAVWTAPHTPVFRVGSDRPVTHYPIWIKGQQPTRTVLLADAANRTVPQHYILYMIYRIAPVGILLKYFTIYFFEYTWQHNKCMVFYPQ